VPIREIDWIESADSALVRLDGVRELVASTGGRVYAALSTGERIPIARRRRALFAAALKAR
jgi:DNA-binding LytR/AlgR family response regulator